MRIPPCLALSLVFSFSACTKTPTPTPTTPTTATATATATPTPTTMTTSAPSGPSDEDCTRANAADDEGVVDPKRAPDYAVVRDKAARTLTERFTFEGFSVSSEVGGCAHAGQVVVVKGPLKRGDKEALAHFLETTPMQGEHFVGALRSKAPCDQFMQGREVLVCGDAIIDLVWGEGQATLRYDFAL